MRPLILLPKNFGGFKKFEDQTIEYSRNEIQIENQTIDCVRIEFQMHTGLPHSVLFNDHNKKKTKINSNGK